MYGENEQSGGRKVLTFNSTTYRVVLCNWSGDQTVTGSVLQHPQIHGLKNVVNSQQMTLLLQNMLFSVITVILLLKCY